jgi:hypothetical protein
LISNSGRFQRRPARGLAYRRKYPARPLSFSKHDPAIAPGLFIFIGAYSMTQEEEYTIRSQLKWKRDGSDWVLLRGRRRMGRVTPDVQYAGMWRSPKSGGRVSDMANLSWAKDAVMAEGIRELAWKTRQQAA